MISIDIWQLIIHIIRYHITLTVTANVTETTLLYYDMITPNHVYLFM